MTHDNQKIKLKKVASLIKVKIRELNKLQLALKQIERSLLKWCKHKNTITHMEEECETYGIQIWKITTCADCEEKLSKERGMYYRSSRQEFNYAHDMNPCTS